MVISPRLLVAELVAVVETLLTYLLRKGHEDVCYVNLVTAANVS
jgi:hypothetical protein